MNIVLEICQLNGFVTRLIVQLALFLKGHYSLGEARTEIAYRHFKEVHNTPTACDNDGHFPKENRGNGLRINVLFEENNDQNIDDEGCTG